MNIDEQFKEPLAPEMRDITREAWLRGWQAAKSGENIEDAFDEFRGLSDEKAA